MERMWARWHPAQRLTTAARADCQSARRLPSANLPPTPKPASLIAGGCEARGLGLAVGEGRCARVFHRAVERRFYPSSHERLRWSTAVGAGCLRPSSWFGSERIRRPRFGRPFPLWRRPARRDRPAAARGLVQRGVLRRRERAPGCSGSMGMVSPFRRDRPQSLYRR